MSSIKIKGRSSLGFPMFAALSTLAFNLCYLREFNTEILVRIWKAAGHLTPVTKTGLGENRVLTRLRQRTSQNFLFKKESPFAVADMSLFVQQKDTAGKAASAASTTPGPAPARRFANDAEKYGYDIFGCIDYLGAPIVPKVPADEEDAQMADDEPPDPPSRAASPEHQPPASPEQQPPASPVRRAIDVSSESPGPASDASEANVVVIHNCKIYPGVLRDEVLLNHNGCYTDDLVDLFFRTNAIKTSTQCASVLVAQKLSEVNSDATGRYMPGELLNYGTHLRFDKATNDIIAFPVSVTTHTSSTSTGAPVASTDFHYSTAVYSFSQNKLFHADSLRYESHITLVMRQLARWIQLLVEKQLGAAFERPQRVHVPCPNQGMAMHCGPATCLNSRFV